MDMFRDLDCEALSVRDTPAGINLAVNPKKSDLFPSSASMEFTTLPEAEYSLVDYYAVLTSTALRTVINPYRRNSDADFRFLLLVPIPPKWSDFEPSWMSATFDLIHKAPRSDSFPDSHKLLICFSSAIGWGGKNDSVVNATAADADIDRPFSSAVDDREQEFMTELAQGGLRQRRLFRADGSIKIDEDVDVSTARKLFSSALDFESLAIEENHRRLEDTYAASLLNVNRLLNKVCVFYHH
jgi:hypothetical protein